MINLDSVGFAGIATIGPQPELHSWLVEVFDHFTLTANSLPEVKAGVVQELEDATLLAVAKIPIGASLDLVLGPTAPGTLAAAGSMSITLADFTVASTGDISYHIAEWIPYQEPTTSWIPEDEQEVITV